MMEIEHNRDEVQSPPPSSGGDFISMTPAILDTSWIPRSGYGPSATIPLEAGIDEQLLRECGIPGFAQARREVRLMAREYAQRAVRLVARSKADRLALARELQGSGPAFRPYRARLCLELNEARGYLYLQWRFVGTRKGRIVRECARQWSCQSDLTALLSGVHPAEEHLIRTAETEATDIRLRWFALVRQVHYMNVTEELRHADYAAGLVKPTAQVRARAIQWLRDVIG
jgi:hypothetical protein